LTVFRHVSRSENLVTRAGPKIWGGGEPKGGPKSAAPVLTHSLGGVGASNMIDIDLGFVTIKENIPIMNQNKRQKTTKIEIRNFKSGKEKAWSM
jgi:hypothetical protein